jgi:DNA repair exonuclease SbcCD ATPase subunit
MINTLDQKVISEVIQTPVREIESLQICPLSTSHVFLTVTGYDKSYSSNKSDIFNVSKVCEKSVIERVFTNPSHHQNELRKQLRQISRFNQVNQTEKLDDQDKALQPKQVVPLEQEVHLLIKHLSEKEHQLKNQTQKNQNLNDKVQELLSVVNTKNNKISSLEDNNTQLKSQLELKDNQLNKAKLNGNELDALIKKLLKTLEDKIKEIENHVKTISSLELNFKNLEKENKDLLDRNNRFKEELFEITRKYNLLLVKPQRMMMIQKTLLLQSKRRNIHNHYKGCRVLGCDDNDGETNKEGDGYILRSEDQELRTTLDVFRKENRQMIIENETIKGENQVLKGRCEELVKQVGTTSELIKYW